MRIWEHTLKELIGDAQTQDADDGEMYAQPFIPQSVVPITFNPKYATAMLRGGGSFAHQVLLELRDGQWVCVGSYVDDTIFIDPNVRGKGLAEELVLRCADHRPTLPLTTMFSTKGRKLLERTHELAIERALAAGLEVPQTVMEDFERYKAKRQH